LAHPLGFFNQSKQIKNEEDVRAKTRVRSRAIFSKNKIEAKHKNCSIWLRNYENIGKCSAIDTC
jgi:hypothetical protein